MSNKEECGNKSNGGS